MSGTLLWLSIGLALGLLIRLPDSVAKASDWASRTGISVLVVTIGANLTSRDELQAAFVHMGGAALLLAMAWIAGSVVFSHLVVVATCLAKRRHG